MDILTSLGLDIFAIITLFIVLLSSRRRDVKISLDKRLFTVLTLLTVLFLIIDILYLAFYGKDTTNVDYLLFIKTIYFIINITISFLWYIYVVYKVYDNEYLIRKNLLYYFIPFAIAVSLIIINLFTGIVFKITSEKTFEASVIGMWIYTFMSYIYVCASLIVIITNKKILSKRNFWSLLLYPIPPLIGTGIQIGLRNVSLIGTYSFSVLIVYLNIQNDLANLDGLTGIANRRSLSEYLHMLFNKDRRKYFISGIMLDVDNLKRVNDSYGHLMGDLLLQEVVRILQNSTDYDDFVARYAGDEFMVILVGKDSFSINQLLEKIEVNRIAFNNEKKLPFPIEFSIGYYISLIATNDDVDSFLYKLDSEMYIKKKERKEANSYKK